MLILCIGPTVGKESCRTNKCVKGHSSFWLIMDPCSCVYNTLSTVSGFTDQHHSSSLKHAGQMIWEKSSVIEKSSIMFQWHAGSWHKVTSSELIWWESGLTINRKTKVSYDLVPKLQCISFKRKLIFCAFVHIFLVCLIVSLRRHV